MVQWGGGELGVPLDEVEYMLRDGAWREVNKARIMEAEGRSKLGMVKHLMEGGCRARCVQVARKGLRQIVAKLRGGSAELRVETGRWIGLEIKDRICGQCM